MLMGDPPFYGSDQKKLEERILRDKVSGSEAVRLHSSAIRTVLAADSSWLQHQHQDQHQDHRTPTPRNTSTTAAAR